MKRSVERMIETFIQTFMCTRQAPHPPLRGDLSPLKRGEVESATRSLRVGEVAPHAH
jgi:hypothetical protein